MAVKADCRGRCGVWMLHRLSSKRWTYTLFSLWSLQKMDTRGKKIQPLLHKGELRSCQTGRPWLFSSSLAMCIYKCIKKIYLHFLFLALCLDEFCEFCPDVAGRLKRWEATRWLPRRRREGGWAGCLEFLRARLTLPDSQLGWLTTMARWCLFGGPSQPMNVYSSKCQ